VSERVRERDGEGAKGEGCTTGEFLYPFQNENTPPPIHPMANAAPQYSMIRHGLSMLVV